MGDGLAQNLTTILPMLLIFVVIIFVMYIPQRKQKKKRQEMMDSLKAGNKVTTIGGIVGKIASVKEDFVLIEVGPDKAKLVFVKGAIASVSTSEEGEVDLIDAKDVDKK